MKQEKFYFKFESTASVGNAFQEIYSGNCNPVARAECLYHYCENGILHIWVDRVTIKWVYLVGDFNSPAREVVLHSDYTLEQLSQVSNERTFKQFVKNIERKE